MKLAFISLLSLPTHHNYRKSRTLLLSLDFLLLTIIMATTIAGWICNLWCFTTMKILNPLMNMISLISLTILWCETRTKTFNTHSHRWGEWGKALGGHRELLSWNQNLVFWSSFSASATLSDSTSQRFKIDTQGKSKMEWK